MEQKSALSNDDDGNALESPANGIGRVAPNIDLLRDIELPVMLRFGSAQMSLKSLTDLTAGAVIELDRALTERVEVLVGGYVVARGEPIMVHGAYGVRISEIASRQERILSTAVQASASKGNNHAV